MTQTAPPDNVRPDQIVGYDYHGDPRLGVDLQASMHALLADAPDVFWSPENGGFWVVKRLALMTQVLRDTEHFSNRELDIPKSNSPYLMIPLNLDPPEHLAYRMVLMRHFDPKHVRAMEPIIRTWANRLIDRVIDTGRCEFTEDVGAAFPVSVFMELMGLPLDRFEEFRAIVHEYFGNPPLERRIALQEIIMAIMWEYFEKRRAEPADDLISTLVQETVKGRPLSDDELKSIGFLLFIAGLDTVANTLTFTFRLLALDAALQDRLARDPAAIPDFIEEALRRCSIVNQPRLVKKDIVIGGAHFREGDMVVCPLALAGMDETRNPDPERIDVDRADRAHLAFSAGPHVCIGNFLARAEMRILTEEWMRRIPRFAIASGTSSQWRSGGVMAIKHLELEWPRG